MTPVRLEPAALRSRTHKVIYGDEIYCNEACIRACLSKHVTAGSSESVTDRQWPGLCATEGGGGKEGDVL